MSPSSHTSLRLLVFDWDGTLMDSVGTIVACTQAVVRDLELGDISEEKIRRHIGLGLRETIDLLVPGCPDSLFESIVESYREHWLATYRHRPILYPGVEEMLRALADRGWLMAVATGKGRRGLDHALAQTGLEDFFHATRTVDEAFSKPHPQMLLDIMTDLGVSARQAVMIGDTTFDLEMARNAGTASIGVCTGTHRRDELESLGPLTCLDSVAELPAWLAALDLEPARSRRP